MGRPRWSLVGEHKQHHHAWKETSTDVEGRWARDGRAHVGTNRDSFRQEERGSKHKRTRHNTTHKNSFTLCAQLVEGSKKRK